MRLTTLSIAVVLGMSNAAGNYALAQNQIKKVNTDSSKAELETETIEVVATKPQGILVSSKQIVNMPGGFGDPLKAIDALPGVVLATPSSGGPVAQPAIRGSSPMDNQYFSDFLPIGYVFHQDSLSTFNPELISGFELKTAGWSGQYNDAIGGVIATELRDPSFEKAQAVLDLSMIRSGLLVESPITDDLAFYLSYRESLIHNFVDDMVEDEDFTFSQPPRNHDFQAKMVWDANPNNAFKLVATGAKDKVRQAFKPGASSVARNPDLASGEGYTSNYNNVGLIWLNSSGLGETTAAINYLTTQLKVSEGIAEQSESTVDELMLKSVTQTSLSDHSLTWGAEIKQQNISLNNTSRLQACNREFENCLPSGFSPIVNDNTEVDVNFASVFSDLAIQQTERWQTTLGAALSYNDYTSETFLEPRLSAQYQVNSHSRIGLSLGQYHQWFRNLNYLSTTFGNPDLKQSTANMIGASFEQTLTNAWQWKIDVYYKQLDKLIMANPASQQTELNPNEISLEPQFVNQGEGTAWGAELMINKSLQDNWYGWFTLAYANTERKNKMTGEKFEYEFDLPIIANLVAKYQINDKWHIGVKWAYQSGRRYTEVLSAQPVYPTENGEPDTTQAPLFYQPMYGTFNDQRREAGHRMDIRVDYHTHIANHAVNVYLDVLNVYGNQRIQEDEWNADYTEKTPDYEFPDEMFPGIGVSVRF
ncbi:TonB-dependent receptor plug domain-containing protein [Algibacillus agarilyticus]|uniref:TonB-dependent receptor plug domain-containing protein n=1 Tax=Algibacillus agarilyticus TaxID=2234133 RepID=UPI000DD02A59|nr:TonB-dependent receptor plug domain-containing protein [Algibacillus agarilyticus]